MKKKPNVRAGGWSALKKICTIMKLCLILSLFAVFSVSAGSMAQNAKLSMEKKSVSLIEVLNELSEKSDYEFFYNDNEVKGVKVSVSVKDATVSEILDHVLQGTALKYQIVDHVIVISPQKDEQAQEKGVWRVSGIVKDQHGVPLPGVTIILKGSSTGTATDASGKFKMHFIDENETVTLVFSFIGMISREVVVKDFIKENLEIVMHSEEEKLDEVIVTGMGNKSKNSFTGSATVVSRQQLMSVGTKSLLQSLAAFVPGLQIVKNNEMGSDPNTRPEILIRGRSSFEGSSNVPTFIVDGAEVDLDYVFDMDMNGVETVTVLKDASASALYGSKAAKGVVVITTKPLRAGKLRVSYSGTLRTSIPDVRDYDLLNAAEKLEYERLAGVYDDNGKFQYEKDTEYNEKFKRVREGVDTDWLSKPLRNSVSQNHNLNIAGGDEYIRYSLGARYGSEQGVMEKSKRDRYSLNFRLSYNKQDKVYVSNSTTITSVNSEESPYGTFNKYVELNPYDRAYNLDGSLNKVLSFNVPNPLFEATLGSYDRSEQFYLNNVLDLRVEVLPGFRVEGFFSLNKSKDDTEKFTSPEAHEFNNKEASESGRIEISNKKSMTYEGRVTLSYNKMFGTGTLLNAMGGANIQSSENNGNGYTAVGLYSDKLGHPAFATRYPEGATPQGSQGLERSMGLFLNANVIYDDRYFADASIRYEGSSKFGEDQRFTPFWSLGLGWNIHKEKFLNMSGTDRIKLRGSLGYTGNASFSPYQAMTTYKYDAGLDYDKGIGAIPMAIGNPDLKWERALTYNVGLDVVLFKNRLDFTLEYYNKTTDNLLLDVAKAPSVGTTTAKENMGKLLNTGIELQTRVVAISNKYLNWSLSLNMQHNENKIKKISNALEKMNEELNTANGTLLPPPVYVEGESLSAVKAVKSGGIDPATGQEVFIDRFGNPTFVYNYWDKRTYGDSDPTLSGTFGTYLTFKGFSLNMLFHYELGATVYNQTLVTRVEGANPQRNADKRVFHSRWKKVGDRVKYKNIADQTTPDITSRFVRDEYMVNMQSLSLSYDFTPEICQKLYLSRLRVEFLMNDVFRASTIKQERGFSYPFARSFEFSLSAAF